MVSFAGNAPYAKGKCRASALLSLAGAVRLILWLEKARIRGSQGAQSARDAISAAIGKNRCCTSG